jgi:hypothetical protein
MKFSMKMRALTLAASVALVGGTALVASGETGAYFSQTVPGSISGTVGSIHITPSTSTDLSFSNLLPGAPQTVTVHFENTGSSPEDVYLAFPNATALSALNNLGSYGEVHVSYSGPSSVNNGDIFDSANLDDNPASCGPFSPTGCWPLLNQYELATNLASGASGSFTFSFSYPSKMTIEPPSLTAPWNSYPVSGVADSITNSTVQSNQWTINAADGTGAGLPFQLIATQPGIQP